jgi:hypothetical protein
MAIVADAERSTANEAGDGGAFASPPATCAAGAILFAPGQANPHGANPHAGRAARASAPPVLLTESTPVVLDGLKLTAPAGWLRDPIQPGPRAAQAAFVLPKSDGESADGTIRITHYPKMKGMDEANIKRWIGQVQRSDGAPSTRDDAKISVSETGKLKRTVVELAGSVRATMRAKPVANARMIAVILDHAKGPHFIVVAGGVKTIEKWEASVRAFLDSATVE